MTLDRLTQGLDILETSARTPVVIDSVQTDSRKCTHGSLFVAVEGNAVDGHTLLKVPNCCLICSIAAFCASES